MLDQTLESPFLHGIYWIRVSKERVRNPTLCEKPGRPPWVSGKFGQQVLRNLWALPFPSCYQTEGWPCCSALWERAGAACVGLLEEIPGPSLRKPFHPVYNVPIEDTGDPSMWLRMSQWLYWGKPPGPIWSCFCPCPTGADRDLHNFHVPVNAPLDGKPSISSQPTPRHHTSSGLYTYFLCSLFIFCLLFPVPYSLPYIRFLLSVPLGGSLDSWERRLPTSWRVKVCFYHPNCLP